MSHLPIDQLPFNLSRLQREVNILLLSDLHYDKAKDGSVPKHRQGLEVNKKLLETLNSLDPEWYPDIVIVAGDLVNMNVKDNYRYFDDLIQGLVGRFSHLRNAIFTTPGNHDVNRDNFMSVLPYLRKMADCKPADLMKSFTNNKWVDILHTLTKRTFKKSPGLCKALSKYESQYFETYLENRKKLSSKPKGSKEPAILRDPELQFPVEGINTVYYKQIHGLTLVCHNSSFFCNISQASNDRNHLFLVKDIVEQTIEKVKRLKDAGPVISFLHHPFYYLHETEHIAPVPIDDAESDQFNNFNKIVRNSDIVLSGHVHGELHDPAYLQNSAYLITNGTSYTTDDMFREKCYPFTFALIKVNKQLRKFALKKYRYVENQQKSDAKYETRPAGTQQLPYYNLFDRPGTASTSLEIEKVKTLHYFARILEDKKDLRAKLFLCQLQPFHEKMGEDGKGEYEFSESFHNQVKARVFSFTEGPCGPVRIVLVEEKYSLDRIAKTLKSRLSKLSGDGMIYFSVNKKLLFDKNDELQIADLQTLQKAYRVLALSSKIDNLSINLLFH